MGEGFNDPLSHLNQLKPIYSMAYQVDHVLDFVSVCVQLTATFPRVLLYAHIWVSALPSVAVIAPAKTCDPLFPVCPRKVVLFLGMVQAGITSRYLLAVANEVKLVGQIPSVSE